MIRTLAAILILMLLQPVLTGCMTPEKRARLERVREVWREIPVYPDFKQVDYDESVKEYSALITCFYESSSSYANVKGFYTKELLSRGWSVEKEETIVSRFPVPENPITFRKGNFKFVLTENGLWTPPFSIDLFWRD